jgi:hypothetical protein
MGTDGACSLLLCAAKRSGAFLPNMPAGLRARVSRLGGFTRPLSGYYFPPAGARFFFITGEAVTSRFRRSPILMGWWSEKSNDFTHLSSFVWMFGYGVSYCGFAI